MERKKRTKRKNRGKRFSRAAVIGLTFAVTGIAACAGVYFVKKDGRETPEELLSRYMALIGKQDYEGMYEMTDPENSAYKDREAFIQRNSAIYEGIEAENIQVEIQDYDGEKNAVTAHRGADAGGHFRRDVPGYGCG